MATSPEHNLGALERAARRLDPDAAERKALTAQVLAHAEKYLRAVPEAPAYFHREDHGRSVRADAIPEHGRGLEAVLERLRTDVDEVGINTTSGRFFGYIPGGGLFHSALGDFLAAVTNRYAGVFFASPGAVHIENRLIEWMAGLVGYPEGAAGYLAAGGSMANFTAIVTAREAHGVEGDRIASSVVYLTEHAHHCIEKALHLAGLKRCPVRKIPVDATYRMDADALEQTVARDRDAGLHPWLVVGSAGTTNTGSVDPLDRLADIAESCGAWFHVDAAYGGFFALCPEGKAVLGGMHRSDSIVMDPHKTLFLPYGTGALIVRRGEDLLRAHHSTADYLQDTLDAQDEWSPAQLSPELTKHFRGLRLWLPLQIMGLAPFRAALSEKIHLARLFHAEIGRVPGFETGPPPDLSVVTYRYVPSAGDPDAFNRRLAEAVRKDGRIFVSTTVLDGRVTLRLAAVCFRTHREDVETAVRVLSELAARLNQSDPE